MNYASAAKPLELIFSETTSSEEAKSVGGFFAKFAGRFLRITYPAKLDPAFVHKVRFSECLTEVLEMRKLRRDWNSYGADRPSDQAIRNALAALEALKKQARLPARIRPTADESIIFDLARNGTGHLMEFYSDGDIVILEHVDGREEAHDMTVEEMREFISRFPN